MQFSWKVEGYFPRNFGTLLQDCTVSTEKTTIFGQSPWELRDEYRFIVLHFSGDWRVRRAYRLCLSCFLLGLPCHPENGDLFLRNIRFFFATALRYNLKDNTLPRLSYCWNVCFTGSFCEIRFILYSHLLYVSNKSVSLKFFVPKVLYVCITSFTRTTCSTYPNDLYLITVIIIG
jgi:hypothetical protein